MSDKVEKKETHANLSVSAAAAALRWRATINHIGRRTRGDDGRLFEYIENGRNSLDRSRASVARIQKEERGFSFDRSRNLRACGLVQPRVGCGFQTGCHTWRQITPRVGGGLARPGLASCALRSVPLRPVVAGVCGRAALSVPTLCLVPCASYLDLRACCSLYLALISKEANASNCA